MRGILRLEVCLPPFILLFVSMLLNIFDHVSFLSITSKLNTLILDKLDWLFLSGGFVMVITCIIAFISPLGSVIIGGKNSTPILSKWRWATITLCTTSAAGILFWATAEPLFHLYSPPKSLNLIPGSAGAANFSLSTMYMHWSLTPFAIYSVPALAFALAYYNLKSKFSISSAFIPVIGKKRSLSIGWFIDSMSMFALISGMASSLGTGGIVLASGISKITGLNDGSFLLGVVIVTIVVCFILSSISGLHKGIAGLSFLNTTTFIIIATLAFTFGPSKMILLNGMDALYTYFDNFVVRSFATDLAPDDNWAKNWTVFYWANWLSWAPIVALFLGKISKGYSVRSFLLVNLVLPSTFSILWMTIFSGIVLQLDIDSNGTIYTIAGALGPGAIVYALLERLPLPHIFSSAFILVAFLSYVTAADSNTEIISTLCIDEKNKHANTLHKNVVKIVCGCIIAVIAWYMTAYSGIEGIKMISNLGGLPALIIVIAMNMSVFVWILRCSYVPVGYQRKIASKQVNA
ncbi:MAG: BCCT family transporter [Shewanella sp.]|uniref:BCCT family transporter n=1 Tax=Shewanella sp. TaxID=50422 RepID=UPI003F39AF55